MELDFLLEKVFRLNEQQKGALKKLGLLRIRDLLFYFPARYNQFVESAPLSATESGASGTWYGKISHLKLGKSFRKRIAMAEGKFTDSTGSIKLVWFNQPYLAKMIREGSLVKVAGKILTRNVERYIANPEIEEVPELPTDVKDSLFGKDSHKLFSYPIYPESRGINSGWFYHNIQKILKVGLHLKIGDPIPTDILTKYHLPQLSTALIWIHNPKKSDDSLVARKRFAFEEVFLIQLTLQKERREYTAHQSFIINKDKKEVASFISRFPFKATSAQEKAIAVILNDFKSGRPMSRLLEGDVGSGKTAVAATSCFAAVTTRPKLNGKEQDFGTLQIAYMAPTEILATQHFESFIQYFKHLPIQIALITGSGCRKFPSKLNHSGWTNISRPQLLKWVANGEIAIVIGTHALIQKTVKFKNLSYIIIDEQHRFGTKQRQKLSRKSDPLPHLLSMTATPIPRTLALTIYGDLDLTLLDEMPHGRKKIITEIVSPTKRKETYEKIHAELKAGRQVYIICPRIDEPDPEKEMALIAKSVKAEAERLNRDIFPKYNIGILHSKLKPKEKDEVMLDFKNKKIDILVATSVVEVGVNVENATVIVIEGAERFGLAQLHQLRGRVIRSNHQAYCYLFPESAGAKTNERLKALVTAKNGFELAEYDLQLRGAGELAGNKQWGISDIGMEAIKNLKMVEAARQEATRLINDDPSLSAYPALAKIREEKAKSLHFE
ncbi:MAG: ATP-dependent DNA helicase RecG [bacterium]|nr:ATP-dependent DNA helicase RecG [bacterium]